MSAMEFDVVTQKIAQMMSDGRPRTISDIMRMSGLTNRPDVSRSVGWLKKNNILRNRTCAGIETYDINPKISNDSVNSPPKRREAILRMLRNGPQKACDMRAKTQISYATFQADLRTLRLLGKVKLNGRADRALWELVG